jgi:ABC-2 type transport system permease protein
VSELREALRAPAGGTIYDRGYRHYDGPREGRSRKVRAMVVASVRRALGLRRNWKTKVVPWGLLVLAFAPAAAFVGIRVVVGEAAGQFVGYGQYLRIVAVLMLLFAATAGPEILCPDRQTHTLTLILTRPVTRLDYVLAKLVALALVICLIALVPLLTLFVGNVITAAHATTYLRQHLGDLARIVAAGVTLTAFFTAVSLAAASLTERRSAAIAGLLGTFLGSAAVADSIYFASSFSGRRWVLLLSPWTQQRGFVTWVFGTSAGGGPGALSFAGITWLVAMLVVIAGSLALLTWRIMRVQA